MIRRIYRITAVLTAAGVAIAGWLGGVPAAMGFLAGSGYSILSFRFLHGVVDSLGSERPRMVGAVFLTFRFLILGVGLYVIMNASESSLPAALCGLFTAFAAVILESIYQLYARTS